MERVFEALRRNDAKSVRGRPGKRFNARCPAHDDHNPTLRVTTGRQDRALITCHAGCKRADVLKALGLTWADLFVNRKPPLRQGRVRKTGGDAAMRIVTVLGMAVPAPAHRSLDGRPEPKGEAGIVYRAIMGHAFFDNTCCPSQELIAAEIRRTREHVNRMCRLLKAGRYLDWRQLRRSGSKWRHNIYVLLGVWHRPYRQKVIRNIQEARERLRAADHTKRATGDVERKRWGGATSHDPLFMMKMVRWRSRVAAMQRETDFWVRLRGPDGVDRWAMAAEIPDHPGSGVLAYPAPEGPWWTA